MDKVIEVLRGKGMLPGSALGNDDNALYVNGLPSDCQDIHLFRLCAPFGAVAPHGVMAMKNPDGSCRGFGFVNFVDASSVQAAAAALHMAEMPDGTYIKATPKRSGNNNNKGGQLSEVVNS